MVLIVANTYRAADQVARQHMIPRDEWRHVREAYQVLGHRPEKVLYGWDANQVDPKVFAEITRLDAKGMIGSRSA